ncbi:citrate lyase holo-[acyl-carrier protein] synthase [Wukongibacter baidiensis]|uniref:citrate lyase holo-[acyl-carrier protein] synthase n=1 Tax=Wukongibacter baidiensis TaxID=1723361 RepID=UPI003D7FCB50
MTVNANLKNILEAREKRVAYQKRLIQKYSKSLIAFKLNIPGPKKDGPLYRKIFINGLALLKDTLKENHIDIVFEDSILEPTGSEAFIVVDSDDAKYIKTLSIEIEEKDSMGRIYDFDVIDSSGKSISREIIGRGQRKCFLCDEYVWVCARTRAHSLEEMLQFIEETAKAYFKINKSEGGI